MLRSSPITITTGVLIALFIITSFHFRDQLPAFPTTISHSKTAPTNLFGLPEHQNWTHIIWESSKYPAQNQTEEETHLARTWADMNPTYRHEMMTHERVLGYVQDHFRYTYPELEQLYLETEDYMLRTDVLRYLVLLKEGGIYSDLDVECLAPIDTWIPADFKDKEEVGMVLGIETDHSEGEDGWLWQLVVWTMKSKPNQPFVRFVLSRLMDRMRNVTAEQQNSLTQGEVLDLTGPAATTKDFLEYAKIVTGDEGFSYRNVSLIREPVMVGEVLLLPIWAFGASWQVSNSGFKDEEKGRVLVRHHFANSWKEDHKEGGQEHH